MYTPGVWDRVESEFGRVTSGRISARRTLWPTCLLVVPCVLGSVLAGPAQVPREPTARQSPLEAARDSLASRENIRLLKSLVLKGMARTGFNGVTGEPNATGHSIEIRMLLPDHYLRIDSDGRLERRAGFGGGTLLNQWRALRPDVDFRASWPADQIMLERQTCARLLLGMLALKDPALGVRVVAESTDDDMRTLELVGHTGFSARLDLQRPSLVPLRLRVNEDVRFPVAMSAAQKRAGVPPLPSPERAEVVWLFEDRRVVSGLNLPHRFKRVARNVVLEDWRIDGIVVNPPLRQTDFVRQ